ncbi:hypothetical protein IJ425_00975 [bacterium]|nr:hypothetical protein [bacterium]
MDISNLELRDIQISRTLRQTQRQMHYDQSIIKNNKAADLLDIKETYDEVKSRRPEDMQSEEYAEWQQEYQDAQEEYQYEKLQITEMYDDQLAMLEEEASDKEAELQQEQTTVEAQLEAMRSEFDVVKEQISKDIESSVMHIK